MSPLAKPDYDDRYTISLPRLRLNQHYKDDLLPFNPGRKLHVDLFNRFGLYLFREQHYDFPLEWNDREEEKTEAYFLIGGNLDWTTAQPVGAAVFMQQPYTNVEANDWWLMWVWIHPFARRRCILSRAWPIFQRKFGDFKVQRPISISMQAFLDKQQERVAEAVK